MKLNNGFTLIPKSGALLVGVLLIAAVFALSLRANSTGGQMGDAVAANPAPAPSVGDTAAQRDIKSAIAKHTNNRYVPDEVKNTPVPGIYEIRVGMEIFYTDSTGRYAFVENHMIDLVGRQDLTQERLDQIASINFKDLPLELALKKVQGNGKRIVAVFEDPYCPICRSFHQFMAQMQDVTIYTFAYPVISAESDTAAKAALCADDKQSAWENLVLNGTVPTTKTCETPVGQIVQLAQKLGVRGTPTVFFGNGRRVHGAVPPDQFVAMLEQWGYSR
jgi:thiol:disulfide interchange protein DsbC